MIGHEAPPPTFLGAHICLCPYLQVLNPLHHLPINASNTSFQTQDRTQSLRWMLIFLPNLQVSRPLSAFLFWCDSVLLCLLYRETVDAMQPAMGALPLGLPKGANPPETHSLVLPLRTHLFEGLLPFSCSTDALWGSL